jgi:flagellar hook assembly protein FlgD
MRYFKFSSNFVSLIIFYGLLAHSNPCQAQSCCPDRNSIITNYAGAGTAGYTGDNGPATLATFDNNWGMAVDSAGDLYFADSTNNVVRKITPGGIVTTVAGNGTPGFSGDGGAATSAQLDDPSFLALDSTGNLYIADYDNHRVRKVTPAGIISTFAGDGSSAYAGDGGPATLASFNGPYGVAINASGDVFIPDDNGAIREVNTGGVISTIAGTGVQGFSGDGGPATLAEMTLPDGPVLDPAGNIYFWDNNNHRVREINTCGIITTVAGNGNSGASGAGGPATLASFSDTDGGFAFCGGNMYIADYADNYLYMINSCGILNVIAGNGSAADTGDGGIASASTMSTEAIVIDGQGNMYVAARGADKIRKIAPDCSPTPTPACAVIPTPTGCAQITTATFTPTLSPTYTPSSTTTLTATMTATLTATYSATTTPTQTPTFTPTVTDTFTPISTSTATATFTPTFTATYSPTTTSTPTPTFTPTVTGTFTSSFTCTNSPTPTPTPTWTSTFTITFTPTVTGTPTPTGSPTATAVPEPYNVTLSVYNSAGELVKILLVEKSTQPVTSLRLGPGNSITSLTGPDSAVTLYWNGTPLSSWNGTNSSGNPVSNGTYFLKVDSVDSLGSDQSVVQNVTVSRPLGTVLAEICNAAGEVVKTLYAAQGAGGPVTAVQLSSPLLQENPAASSPVTIAMSNAMTLVWDGIGAGGSLVTNGVYYLEIISDNGGGGEEVITRDLTVVNSGRPGAGAIAYPNPWQNGDPAITFKASLPDLTLSARLYDLAGERVAVLGGPPGTGQATWACGASASGLYIAVVELRDDNGNLAATQNLKVMIKH